MKLREAGFATVWVVIAIAVVAAAAGAASCYGVAILARHRADAAADAVALTVALHAVEGQPAACRAGVGVAGLNAAALTRCTLSGPTARVSVVVRLPGFLSALGPATAQARAGPASARGPISPSTRR
jgi:secretion/DNA translocation related TadE-like protein